MTLLLTAGYVLWMLACGWCMGTAFDLYNTVTSSTKVLRPIRPAFDLAFWLSSAGIVYYLTFVTIQGEFRIYTFILLCVGYTIYRFTFRTVIVESALFVVRVIRRTLQIFSRVLYGLFGVPLILCFRIVAKLLRVVYGILMALEDAVSRTVRVAMLVVIFPFRRYLQPDRMWRKKLEQLEKGFWEWLSNLLKKNSGSVS